MKGFVGEKCYCQVEVIVPELLKIDCVGEKEWKITLMWVRVKQYHMVDIYSQGVRKKTK